MTKSGQSAKKIKFYKYSEQLSFIKKYFDERETKGNIESQEEEQNKQEYDEQEENNEHENYVNEVQTEKMKNSMMQMIHKARRLLFQIIIHLKFQRNQRYEKQQ